MGHIALIPNCQSWEVTIVNTYKVKFSSENMGRLNDILVFP